MTKPQDIPQDVWDRAIAIETGYEGGANGRRPIFIARAILSAVEEERKQCAQMASDKAAEYRNVGEEDADFCGPIAVRLEAIASAIRNRKES